MFSPHAAVDSRPESLPLIRGEGRSRSPRRHARPVVQHSASTIPSADEAEARVRYHIRAQATSGLLCRLLGLFAQLDLPAPALTVTIAGDSMEVEASLPSFGATLVPTVAHKMARFVGVESVEWDRPQA